MKPAAEMIIVAQKPYAARPVDSITGTGAGALWIEGGRIATDESWSGNRDNAHTHYSAEVFGDYELQYAKPSNPAGRWPPHVALSHTPACTPDACADGCAVKALAEQSGTLTSGDRAPGGRRELYGDGWGMSTNGRDGDSRTAARFFLNTDYLLERLEGAPPFMYTAKADRWQREAGVSGHKQAPLVYAEKAQGPLPQQTPSVPTMRLNHHPTVKPIALTRWLATLLLPPDAYAPRRLLVPFAGSGSEMIGALLAGWDHVQGVELETPYAAIAMQRLEFWQQFAGLDWDTAQEKARAWEAGEQADREREAAGQLPLFEVAQ